MQGGSLTIPHSLLEANTGIILWVFALCEQIEANKILSFSDTFKPASHSMETAQLIINIYFDHTLYSSFRVLKVFILDTRNQNCNE